MKARALELCARHRRRRQTAAYTVIEVLMSMAVLAVGVIGIIATEKVTVAANQHAKNLAIATHIAESWIGMLNAEATLWGSDNVLTDGRQPWLRQGSLTTDWFRPSYVAGLDFGPAFDALGNPMNGTAGAAFCVDLRLAPLTQNTAGGGMVRAEVRVMWLRQQPMVADSDPALSSACSLNALQAGADAGRLAQFVFMSSAVRQVGG